MFKTGVTIGVPVYNEEKYILKTLNSIINQADVIIISDNASTDKTSQICHEFTRKNKHVKYIRHGKSIGAVRNFTIPLENCNTEFFMWIGGHDLLPENYTKELIYSLKCNPTSVLAYAPSLHIDKNDNETKFYDYYFHNDLKSLDPFIRVYSLIDNLSYCTLFHGVYKTKIIKDAFVLDPFVGSDHVILCRVAQRGEFIYNINTFFMRRFIRQVETHEQMMKRVSEAFSILKKNKIPENTLRTGLEQYRVMESLPYDDKAIRNQWLEKSKARLIERFGKFDQSIGSKETN